MEKVPPAEANHGQRSSSDPINYSKQLFHRKKKSLDYLLIRRKVFPAILHYISAIGEIHPESLQEHYKYNIEEGFLNN